MKQLTCEMCGSTDLIKDGGVFVCQICGCKYSIEEAKRMMIEGTVDIQGTVKVDNSTFVKKYLENARRAKEKEDWEETEKYYNMVEQNDPDNIEAIFYSSYGKAKTTLVDGDIYKRQAAFNVLKNCISVIDDHYDTTRAKENQNAIESMAVDICKMMSSNFVFTEWKNGYGVVTKTNKGDTYTLFASLIDGFRESILNIAKVDDHPYLHSSLIMIYTTAKLMDYWKNNRNFISLMDGWINEEKKSLEKIKNARIDKYWSENPEIKQRLDTEKKELIEQIVELQSQIDQLDESKEVYSLEEHIVNLKKEKDSFSYFKVKERKAIQSQIDTLNWQLIIAKKSKSAASKPIDEKIFALTERLKEIDAELTKER